MVEAALTEYVKKLLAQGYGKEAIRQTLLRAGYAPETVREALDSAVTKKISTKVLLIVFLGLAASILIVLFLLRLAQPAPAVLTQSLELFSTQVVPGSELLVTVSLLNPSGTQTKATMDFSITGPEGVVLSLTEESTVRERASVSKSFKLPDNILPGKYSIRVETSYNAEKLTSSGTFAVLEKAAPIQATEFIEEQGKAEAEQEQKTCPIKCDDYNFCTTDSCAEGKCIYSPIVPCCGNKNCESRETEKNCALDCAEQPPKPEEISKEAAELSKIDIEQGITTCETLAQQAYIDSCLLDVSSASKSKLPCEEVGGNDMRDACYIPFAYENDFTVCGKLSNPSTRNACYALQQISEIAKETPEK